MTSRRSVLRLRGRRSDVVHERHRPQPQTAPQCGVATPLTRKLHLGVDADTHEIVASELTSDDIGDVSEVPELLDQIDADLASITADGVYDGGAVYDAVAARHPEASVIHSTADNGPSERDDEKAARPTYRGHRKHGRIGWQRRSGYNRRSLVETAVHRYKTVIGRRLLARSLPNQRTEAKIGCNVLSRMTRLGMPVSLRIV
jgi:hypothetical protein